MKKLFQLLIIAVALTFVASAWGAGSIKTFQQKAYVSGTSPAYTSWDQSPTAANSGSTLVASADNDLTWTGGPGKQNAWPNTTDKRTIDLNDFLAEGNSVKEIIFYTTGVTLELGKLATTSNDGWWNFGVKFAAIDDATIWANARTYYAGPNATGTGAGDKAGESAQGGVTPWNLNSSTSKYAYPVWRILNAGVSEYITEPLPVQRYMRAVIKPGTYVLRNPESWMTILSE